MNGSGRQALGLLSLLIACGTTPAPSSKDLVERVDSAPTSAVGETGTRVTGPTTRETGRSETGRLGETGVLPTGTETGAPPTGPALVFDGPPPRNVLMVSIDTFRRDHLGRYAGDGSTPFLDARAQEGVVLDDLTQCANWTFPSTTCTLLGRSNVENGFIPGLGFAEGDPVGGTVPAGTTFLATVLAEAGYATVLQSTNRYLVPERGNTQGYQRVEKSGRTMATLVAERGFFNLRALVPKGSKQPWLLHLHLLEPHDTYRPPEEYLKELASLPPIPYDLTNQEVVDQLVEDWDSLDKATQEAVLAHQRVRYRGEIRYLDDQLTEIWATAEADGLLDDTLVLFWSDHGEQFLEHGHQRHAWNLHREENDAIGFFWAKNLRPRAVGGPTVSTDLAPTVLHALGVAVPPEMTGVVVGLAPDDRPRFAQTLSRLGMQQSVLQGSWKLIFNWDGRLQLFDRSTDPGEQVDLFAPGHPEAIRLWDLLRPEVEAAVPLVTTESVNWPTL